jgi:hypothetical protein
MRKIHLLLDREAACGKRGVECSPKLRDVSCLDCILAVKRR